VAPYGIGQELFQIYESTSFFARLARHFRRVPFRTKFARDVGTGSVGAWRGEGKPGPIARTTLDTLTQEHYEAAVTMLGTRESFRSGSNTEQGLPMWVSDGVDRFLSPQRLDPSMTATSAHPAAITNAAVSVTSAGTSAIAFSCWRPSRELCWRSAAHDGDRSHRRRDGVGAPG
jgi:hypothetical protein